MAGNMAFLSETGSCVGAEFSQELSSEGSQPHIVARLVERAEASEVQLAQAQQELKALKQVATARAAAEGAGTSAAMSAAQVSHENSVWCVIRCTRAESLCVCLHGAHTNRLLMHGKM